jgi:hypothetical protein
MRLPIEGNLLRNLRVRARQLWKQLNCPHTHTFVFDLEGSHWYSCETIKGKHKGLRLVGCYLCGQVWVEDWMA